MQTSVDPVLPWWELSKLVREISQDFKTGPGFDQGSFEVLRGALEAYMVTLLQDANQFAIHAGRKVVESRDIQLARRIRGERT